MTTDEAIQVLDWALAAACLQVSADPGAGTLDNALAAHFAYLREQAPLTHAVVVALLRIPDPDVNGAFLQIIGGQW